MSRENKHSSLGSSLLKLYQHGWGVPGGSSGGSVAWVKPPTASCYPHPSWRPIAGGNSRLVGPLRHNLEGGKPDREDIQICPVLNDHMNEQLLFSYAYLELSAPEQWLIKGHGHLHGVFLSKLYICKALGVAIILVAKDGDSVDCTTPMEVLLKLLCCGAIIHLSNPIPVSPRGTISHIEAQFGNGNTMTICYKLLHLQKIAFKQHSFSQDDMKINKGMNTNKIIYYWFY